MLHESKWGNEHECPVLKRVIDDSECCDIAIVAEGGTPERFCPPEARKVPDYKDICNKCPHHQD